MDRRVRQVIALMEECLHLGWPASRLARHVNISASRLHQLFKYETGLPPARYLHLLRMGRARELLESSYLSVKEVMARVGVSDESHFVRDFKKIYALTPAKYREGHLNGDLDGSSEAAGRVPCGVSGRVRSFRTPERTSPAPTPFASPPLLLRRASHPRHLADDSAPLLRSRQKRGLLSLLQLRHAAFAQATTAITNDLGRNLSGVRPIVYRPRRAAVSRRPPPAAERCLPRTKAVADAASADTED